MENRFKIGDKLIYRNFKQEDSIFVIKNIYEDTKGQTRYEITHLDGTYALSPIFEIINSLFVVDSPTARVLFSKPRF